MPSEQLILIVAACAFSVSVGSVSAVLAAACQIAAVKPIWHHNGLLWLAVVVGTTLRHADVGLHATSGWIEPLLATAVFSALTTAIPIISIITAKTVTPHVPPTLERSD